MPKPSAPSTQPEIALSPPEVIGVLPPVPGGEDNLLPKDAWLRPLRVEFGWWDDPSPIQGLHDIVQLIWDGDDANPVAQRQYDGSDPPVMPADLWLEAPVAKLEEGVHTVYYRLIPWNGATPAKSVAVNVTIDKTPPALASPDRLVFPPAVLPPNQLTARYLEQNADQVRAGLPVYTTPRPWDRITWYWGETRGNTHVGGVIELDDKNYSAPLVITIPGQLIRDRRDGLRYVWYEVRDRAGNESRPSDPVELNVAATPIPRVLPPVKIKDATAGASSGSLDPLKAIMGATVTIPSTAVINDDEGVFVQWAKEGDPGSHRTDTPITTGSWDYHIPSEKVRYHIGRQLVVSYEVFEPGIVEPHRSNAFTLTVARLIGTPVIQCDKVTGGRLILANVPDGGHANFTLERWSHMGTEQFLTITVTGVGADDKALTIPVLTNSPVPEVAQKIDVGRISKADLQRFKLNNQLEVKVRVSFDGKLTWQTFGSLTPTLV